MKPEIKRRYIGARIASILTMVLALNSALGFAYAFEYSESIAPEIIQAICCLVLVWFSVRLSELATRLKSKSDDEVK